MTQGGEHVPSEGAWRAEGAPPGGVEYVLSLVDGRALGEPNRLAPLGCER